MRFLLIILAFLMMGCVTQKDVVTDPIIHLYEHNNMHFINVTLNGKKTRLLLDTGASKSLLDISQAEEFEFSYIQFSKRQYVGLGGLQDIYVVFDYKIDEVYISFLGTDLSEVTPYFVKEGIDIAGVLGSDFLEKHNVKIDFKKNILIYNK